MASPLIQAPGAQAGGAPDIAALLGPPPPGAGAPQGGGPQQGGPDMPGVRVALQKAAAALQEAETLEGDDADAAQIAQLIAKIKTMIGGHQQLADQAMGAGPGIKLIRKAGTGGAGAGY